MDGRFWNRHSSKLTNEYRRWRTFFINHLRKKPPNTNKRRPDLELPVEFPSKMLFLDDKDIFNDVSSFGCSGSPRFIDELMKDFDGSLDLFLDQPFPNPRDMSMLGNSDIMQPGLTQLQPNSENFHSDLITGLLQQPPMPTIMEDECANAPNFHESFNYPPLENVSSFQQNNQPPPPPLPSYTPSPTYRTYPTPREPEYCCPPVTSSKQLPQPPVAMPSKPQRFFSQREDSYTAGKSRNNLTLLNALLQKPMGENEKEKHHSTSSSSSPEAVAASTMAPFKRQHNLSTGNALIVDLSKERIAPNASSSMYVDDFSGGFIGTGPTVTRVSFPP